MGSDGLGADSSTLTVAVTAPVWRYVDRRGAERPAQADAEALIRDHGGEALGKPASASAT